jgi:hypothetical protein
VNGTYCTSCPAGSYSTGIETDCSLCAAGRYSASVSNVTSCKDCQVGEFQPNAGSSSCNFCGMGYVNSRGVTATQADCTSCGPGKYNDLNASSICSNCEEGYWSNRINASSKSTCLKCPDLAGIICLEGSSLPYLTSGLYRDPSDPGNISVCIPSDACMAAGTGNTTCSSGYTGYACSLCVTEYFRSWGKCTKCMPKAARWVIVLLTSAVVLMALSRLSDRSQSIQNSLRLLLFWMQFLSLYPALSTSWPQALLSFLSLTSIFNLDIGYLGVSCDFSNSYFNILMLKIMLPFLFFGFLYFRVAINYFLSSLGYRVKFELSKLKAFSHMIFVANFFSIQLFSAMLQVFNCVDDGSGVKRVSQDPSQFCFQDGWNRFVVFDSFMLVVYLGVLPAVVIGMYRKAIKNGDLKLIQTLIKPLTPGFREGCEWFELVRFLFKLGFVLVRDVFRLSTKGKIAFLCLLLLMLVWCESNARPYEAVVQQNLSLV